MHGSLGAVKLSALRLNGPEVSTKSLVRNHLDPSYCVPSGAQQRSIELCGSNLAILYIARMIPRAVLPRSGHQVIRFSSLRCNNRGLASAASGTFSYQTGDAAGVKIASRDLPGPTTHLAVVARAGTRYEPLPGFADALEKFAFKHTFRRSALRLVRETELLGGQLSASHSRENLVLSTRFLRDDLPYFAELLGEVISQTKFTGIASTYLLGRIYANSPTRP